ncbi:TonB-dependent receptor [Hymenobacter sp. BT175]|uniref:TonB-dependent receptor n=1 Tax=Hymenobacter translucens TaxID=2886507 RepID=UPI001D0EA9F8|nr:TonB-dependent receptor [Hymenobacter translucens]MCC2547663.1 TonB-dependent receptor [Hymenobacter translucens]
MPQTATLLPQRQYWLLLILLLTTRLATAQLVQPLTGRVTTAAGRPVAGANVVLLGGPQPVQTATDSLGHYSLPGVAPGRYRLEVRSLGFQSYLEPELAVESSKAVYRQVVLTPAVVELAEVRVAAPDALDLHQRAFTVEQTQRFPATFFDPARLVLSQPGVTQANDQGNHVVLHGLSPQGIQWRLEGLPILNPNHLSNAGVRSDRAAPSGGGVNMLSGQLMANSAFRAGALGSRFGNAVSGVFDINLRPGSFSQREHTLQASLLGIDLATEGPLGAGNSSYLVNYRYSTVGLLGQLGVDFGGESIRYQDVSAHLRFDKTPLGQLSLFVLAGNDANELRPGADSLLWERDKDRQRIDFRSDLAVVGLTQSAPAGVGVWQNGAALSLLRADRSQQWLGPRQPVLNNSRDRQRARQLSAYSRYLLPVGGSAQLEAGLQLQAQRGEEQWTELLGRDEERAAVAYTLLQPYAQLEWTLHPTLTLHSGLRLSVLLQTLGRQVSPEPYAQLVWHPSPAHRLLLSYSRQSQVLTNRQQAVLQSREAGPADLVGSQYASLGWAFQVRPELSLSAELFYQGLSGLPANARDVWWNYLSEPDLVATGRGKARSAGLDLGLQRRFQGGLYFQLGSSVFDARYAGTDGQLRNSPFNSRWAGSLTGGKEWTRDRPAGQRVWGLSLRAHSRGGYYYSAIDEALSRQTGVESETRLAPYQERLPAYASLDLRVSHTRRKPGYSRLWSLDIQNITGTPNVGWYYYDFLLQRQARQFQVGIIPVLAYRIQF